MSQFDSILISMKQEAFPAKKQLLEYLLHILQNIRKNKKPMEQSDKAAILAYAFGEVDAFLEAISSAVSYREKDLVFECEDLLLGLIMDLCPDSAQIPQEILAKIEQLVRIVEKERYIETAVDKLFQQESAAKEDVNSLLSLVAKTPDEYQKGKLYAGLVHYQQKLSSLPEGAKAQIAAYFAAELRRYLALPQIEREVIANLELLADVSRYVADDTVVEMLYALLQRGYGNVNFYAVDTLFFLERSVPEEIILALAQNLEYADLTYGMLGKYGKQGLFPKEYSSAEYLAKSDLVHWLTYPTELGKAPDAIEYIGKITYLFRKEVYYVFRYRSNADTLDEQLKNKWLIGWSSSEGGTFSNFDEYALFEKATVDATLKNIKKKLIG